MWGYLAGKLEGNLRGSQWTHAKMLAQQIAAAQTEEIATMQGLLK